MSIQTELTRLENAKAAIKAAIEGKGVTVPDGTLLDGMASLIEGIEAGGGNGNIETITFTPANTGSLHLNFETDGIPFTVVCVRNSFIYSSNDTHYYDRNEVPICCILIGKYDKEVTGSEHGIQYPFHVYNSSTSNFSAKAYIYGSTAITNINSVDSYSVALIKYDLNHPILSVYVNSTDSKGLRVGETYTAMCLFRS